MFRWSPTSWARNASAPQDAPDRGAADLNPLPVSQQLAEMMIINPLVAGTSQFDNLLSDRVGQCMLRPSAAVAMDERANALLLKRALQSS
jgi:hypothetical protein